MSGPDFKGRPTVLGVPITTTDSILVNPIVNGNGAVNQRELSAASTTADDTYGGSDCWYSLTQTASVTSQTLNYNAAGVAHAQRTTQTQASAQRFGRAQLLEIDSTFPLRSQECTLSGRIRVSNSQAIRFAVLEWTGTADSPISDVVNDWTSGTYTTGNFFISTTTNVLAVASITPSADTYTSFELQFTPGSSAANLCVFVWTEGTAAQNFTLDMTEMQINLGSIPQPWFALPYVTELVRCQRFIQVVSSEGNGSIFFGVAQIANTSRAVLSITFQTAMRIPPTISLSAASDFAFFNETVSAFVVWSTGGPFTNTTRNYGALDVTTTTAGLSESGEATLASANAGTGNARMYISAEL